MDFTSGWETRELSSARDVRAAALEQGGFVGRSALLTLHGDRCAQSIRCCTVLVLAFEAEQTQEGFA